MPGDLVSMSVDAEALASLGRLLKDEEDGKQLRKDLAKSIRVALTPARDRARASIAGMHSAGLGHSEGEALRTAIARRIVVEARLSGKATGARIKAKRKGMPRGFEHAPKRTNSAKGWRLNPGGGDTWIVQTGKPHWFDDAIEVDRAQYRAAVLDAMQECYDRIKRRMPKAR